MFPHGAAHWLDGESDFAMKATKDRYKQEDDNDINVLVTFTED
jgi:hypothetical protein